MKSVQETPVRVIFGKFDMTFTNPGSAVDFLAAVAFGTEDKPRRGRPPGAKTKRRRKTAKKNGGEK